VLLAQRTESQGSDEREAIGAHCGQARVDV
jgi:hypothetical protein